MTKKLVYALTMVAAVACIATSCKKDKDTEPTQPDDSPVVPVVADTASFFGGYIEFYGTDYSEANNYSLVLYTDMTTDDDGYFNSKGSAVQIDLYTEDTVLTAGKYTLSAGTYEAGTFDVEYTIWVEIDDNGNQTPYGIQDGTVELAIADDIYTININLTDSLGNARVGQYVGTLDIYDERLNPYDYEPTTPVEITINAPADSIEAANYGDFYEIGMDNINITLWDDDNSVVLSLNVETGATTLPTGAYTVANDYSAMTLNAGYLYYGMFTVGSYAGNDEAIYWITDGKLDVSETDGIYTISGALKSYYGSTININYTGAITLEVYGEAEGAPAAKAKAVRHTHNVKRTIKTHK